MLVVFSTTPNREEAERLAGQIVENKLAACVQILPGITSVYLWEGEVRKDDEYLLLIKTLPGNYSKLEAFIAGNHGYEVPEVVAIEAARVSAGYLAWLEKSLSR